MESRSNATKEDVVRELVPIVRTRSPVAASYVAPVGVNVVYVLLLESVKVESVN